MPKDHLLFSTVDKLAEEQLKYALAGVEDNVWTLFAEDGPMKMFTRQVEDEGGLPIDPLKALHHVQVNEFLSLKPEKTFCIYLAPFS